jgi:hypothetical protein
MAGKVDIRRVIGGVWWCVWAGIWLWATVVPAHGAEPTGREEVRVQVNWAVGDGRHFRFEKVRHRRGYEPFAERYEARVEVQSRSPDGTYRLALRLPEVLLPDRFLPPSAQLAPFFQRAASSLGELVLLLRVNASGEATELENWQALRDRVQDVMKIAGAGAPAASRQSQLQLVKDWYHSETAARESLLADFGFFLTAVGHELVPGEPLEQRQAVPINTLGVKAHSVNRYLLDVDTPGAGWITVTIEQAFDVGDVNQALIRFLERQPEDQRESLKQRVQQEVGQPLKDVGVYVVDRHTGWLVKAEYRREVGALTTGNEVEFRQTYRVTSD